MKASRSSEFIIEEGSLLPSVGGLSWTRLNAEEGPPVRFLLEEARCDFAFDVACSYLFLKIFCTEEDNFLSFSSEETLLCMPMTFGSTPKAEGWSAWMKFTPRMFLLTIGSSSARWSSLSFS